MTTSTTRPVLSPTGQYPFYRCLLALLYQPQGLAGAHGLAWGGAGGQPWIYHPWYHWIHRAIASSCGKCYLHVKNMHSIGFTCRVWLVPGDLHCTQAHTYRVQYHMHVIQLYDTPNYTACISYLYTVPPVSQAKAAKRNIFRESLREREEGWCLRNLRRGGSENSGVLSGKLSKQKLLVEKKKVQYTSPLGGRYITRFKNQYFSHEECAFFRKTLIWTSLQFMTYTCIFLYSVLEKGKRQKTKKSF